MTRTRTAAHLERRIDRALSAGLRRARPLAVAALSLPGLWLVWQWGRLAAGWPHGLGANPQEWTHVFTGRWAIGLLIATLALTPLRGLTGLSAPLLYRRMLGLAAFSYALLHLTNYIVLDQFFAWGEIGRDIAKRPYILAGLVAFLALVPLAATSTRAAVRRLGGRRWRALHRLAYLALAAASLHYLLQMKGLQPRPLIHAGLAALVLGLRPLLARREAFRARTTRKAE